jgi:hypothetical protein
LQIIPTVADIDSWSRTRHNGLSFSNIRKSSSIPKYRPRLISSEFDIAEGFSGIFSQ